MKTKLGLFSRLAKLGKDKRASGRRLLARLLREGGDMKNGFGFFPLVTRVMRDEAGSYLLYVTLLMPFIIGVVGLGTEASWMFLNSRTLQSAADAAAYSAAVAYSNDSTADITAHADAIFKQYGFTVGACNANTTDQANVCASTITFSGLPAIQIIASRPQSRLFSSLWQNSPQPILVSAVAVINGGSNGGGNCLLVMGRETAGQNPPSAADALKISGGGAALNIDMPGCGVFDNSNSNTSIALNGNFKFYAGSVGTAGSVSIRGAHTIGQSPQPPECTTTASCTTTATQGDGTISDPYASTVSVPTTTGTPGSCNAAQVCTPGDYPGLTLQGGTWTLQPGIYVVDGDFQVGPGHGGTIVNGTGVTLVLNSSSSPAMQVLSLGQVNLTPPTTGQTAGYVIMGGSSMPFGATVDTHDNPNSTFTGIIYLPTANLLWGGNPSTGSPTCLQIITNTMTISGDSNLGNVSCNTAVGGQQPIGSIVTLVD